ncbi:hypothetical protein GPECTOR_298g806 [Gonium pectorale]|uniref:Uncharacterized protein n=1 Tax=Gonium pectorale TaxID=33097 RepID=A0A150FVU8_GONPE|nr:hypothetical protein GPECTOR_298g806 [Gonium pectorale]|eukprot:KXZ41742.1 hypothetical protein GPECTOR_298g806 [Gonium pectorale]
MPRRRRPTTPKERQRRQLLQQREHAEGLGLGHWLEGVRAAASVAAANAAAAAASGNTTATPAAAAEGRESAVAATSASGRSAAAAAAAAAASVPLPPVDDDALRLYADRRLAAALAEAKEVAAAERRRRSSREEEAVDEEAEDEEAEVEVEAGAGGGGGGELARQVEDRGGGIGSRGGGSGGRVRPSRLEAWSNVALIEGWLDAVFKNKYYKTVRACTTHQAFEGKPSSWTCYKYTVLCNPVRKQTPDNTNIELYDLGLDPAEVKDSNPFLRIHPGRSVWNLTAAMDPKHDELYGKFQKLQYKNCAFTQGGSGGGGRSRDGPPQRADGAGRPTAAAAAAARPVPAAYTAAAAADPSSELGCRHFGACSGCSLQDGLAAPPLYGEAVEFFRGLGLDEVPAVMKASHGWRCRAKLAVRGPAGRPLVGLFREGSHDVVDIVGGPAAPAAATPAGGGLRRGGGGAGSAGGGSGRGAPAAGAGSGVGVGVGSEATCVAHHPRINQAAALIKELATQLRIQPYNEPPAASGPAARGANKTRGSGPGPGPGRGRGPAPAGAAVTSDTASASGSRSDAGLGSGLLRYVQLTAVPSRPGGRAEEDPQAGVQVVLVINAPPPSPPSTSPPRPATTALEGVVEGAGPGTGAGTGAGMEGGPEAVLSAEEQAAALRVLEADPRVAPAVALCRLLWRMAGPGGPMAPAPAPHPTSTDDPGADVGGSRRQAPAAAAAAPPPLVHSIWLNFQPSADRNAVLGPGWLHVGGPAAAWQEFGGVAAAVGPGSFVQANYGAMQLVLRRIADMVPEGARVTELHAGIGVIGLSLAARRRLAGLRLVEVNPHAAAPFRASLAGLRHRLQQEQQRLVASGGQQEGEEGPAAAAAAAAAVMPDVEYLTAEAGSEPGRFLAGCDTLVVDPPRKGLGSSLLEALTAPPQAAVAHAAAAVAEGEQEGEREGEREGRWRGPRRLVYLSCGFRALQGDLAALLAGGWRLRSATAFLFFPGTDSLETLVLLTRGEEEGKGQEGRSVDLC